MKLTTSLCVVQIFSYLLLSSNCSIEITQVANCEFEMKLHWLWNPRNNDRCVNLILKSSFVPKCFYDRIFDSFVIKTFDLNAIESRNILTDSSPTNCHNFVFFIRDADEAFGMFQTAKHTKRFVPFTQIFIVISDRVIVTFDQNILDHIYKNALFAFVVKNTFTALNELRFLSLTNVLTGKTLDLTTTIDRRDVNEYFGSYRNHPFFDTNFQEKVFRVSLFKCDPYVIYLPDGTFDGIQYRTLREIVNPWRIEHEKCDFSSTIKVPWNTVLYNVEHEISDVAMCSIWMNKPLSSYDPSTYFDLQCGTFLVPKPEPLNPATFLYLSLNVNDWYAFVISMIVMTLCFTAFTKIGMHFFESWSDLAYNDFGRSVLDAFDMATNHGLIKFPRENSIKLLVNSWLIVSFVVGVGYSTGYTSLLNRAVFSRPIDTLEQLVRSDLVIYVNNGDFAKNLIETGSELNIQLAKHVIFDNDTIGSTIQIKRIGKQALFVKIILKNYIGEINNKTDPLYTLRIMKSCILNQYTVVVLKKYSPYTRYLNERMRWLQESGMISYWGSAIEGTNNKYMQPYFTDFGAMKQEPKKLSIENLSGAFILLFIGLSVALLSYALEKVLFNRKFSTEISLSSNFD